MRLAEKLDWKGLMLYKAKVVRFEVRAKPTKLMWVQRRFSKS
jgi:lauroyl/myristoyl acyltransferase